LAVRDADLFYSLTHAGPPRSRWARRSTVATAASRTIRPAVDRLRTLANARKNAARQKAPLFDHLVGASSVKAEHLGCFEIDHQAQAAS
jgi:hypothetical protein